MKAAEKEVEQLERSAREAAGLAVEPEQEGETLPPIEIPPFRVLQRQRFLSRKTKAETERKQLESKVDELQAQIQAARDRLKALNDAGMAVRVSPVPGDSVSEKESKSSRKKAVAKTDEVAAPAAAAVEAAEGDDDKGAMGPDGSYVEFPEYDGSEPPVEWKKPFTQYCNHTRRKVKSGLDPADRKNKVRTSLACRGLECCEVAFISPFVLSLSQKKIQHLLKEGWIDLPDEEKETFRAWTEWDKKRHARDLALFQSRRDGHNETADAAEDDDMKAIHVPKKRKSQSSGGTMGVPKKKKKA